MGMITPRARVEGLGSAKSGTDHWWGQRVTAVALAILTPLFLVGFVRMLGRPHEEVLAFYGRPLNALFAALFIAAAFVHLKQGLQVVIEDYVHSPALKTTAFLANTLLTTAFAAAGIFSLAIIALR
ncbi:succinate dehydrogenase, hydrophobic membrane anchor protein [Neomegalonema sp.]|uniref:succinate dehydrogenase, hydrophobic membrane anchor protein n=1 Tax=Neomegalonema sp. TaxID=2039713 RepID=UPI002635AAA1|nr:succinate dehydrogenase, hydrophobic membrane anchor protein [Neomegalonema sp.]MDD2867587.1 succinate dehydrogenase, hydrophobic membrane anchor protein [Neomegalonema sp.]